MTGLARELLVSAREALSPAENDNRLVPLIASGQAPRSVFATIAAEESRIVHSDWRSFLTIAARCTEHNSRELFTGLAAGEGLALTKLDALARATGMDEAALRAYQAKAGCQAYPAYLAWLCLFGEPADVVIALIANFAAWGGYCATIAAAMREHYGFDDQACGFFDFFATPAPEVEEQAVAALQAGIDAGRQTRQGVHLRPAISGLRADVLEHHRRQHRAGLTSGPVRHRALTDTGSAVDQRAHWR